MGWEEGGRGGGFIILDDQDDKAAIVLIFKRKPALMLGLLGQPTVVAQGLDDENSSYLWTWDHQRGTGLQDDVIQNLMATHPDKIK